TAQTGVYFWYDNSVIAQSKKVDITCKNLQLEKVLEALCNNQSFIYEKIDNKIYTFKKKEDTATDATPPIAEYFSPPPPVRIRGKVTDEQGNPLAKASVIVKGTNHGTATDENGEFSLEINNNAATLTVSYVGYEDAEVNIQGKMELNIVLKAKVEQQQEVVVIGYGTQQKKDLTGSIAVVNSKDFQQGSITTPENLIAGKIAGVSVISNGGSPGAGGTIRIRGISSFDASNDPLIVVDGLPLSGNNIYGVGDPLSLINPNDIASITVLKDAASTAIYGSRAANGVIFITTKRGGSGKPVFNFIDNTSLSTIAKYNDVMTPAQFRQYVDTYGSSQFQSLMGNANTDWQKEIYQPALASDNVLSIKGAFGKNLPYRISGGYLSQQGILKTDNLQRETVGFALSPSLFKNTLKIDLNLNGSFFQRRYANGAAISSSVYFDPTQPVYDQSSPYGGYFEWASTDPNTGAVTLNKLAPRNPLALLDLYSNKANVKRSFGNAKFDYATPFLSGLHAVLNLGYDVSLGKGKIFVPAYAAQNYLDSGQNNQYKNQITNVVSEFYLNYNKDLKSIKSNINAVAGYGYYNNYSKNFSYPNIRANNDTIPGSIPLYPYSIQENTLLSYYARLIYTLNNKYILAASIRYDGSSKFAPDVRWGTFPSVAFTWKINQEKFLMNAKGLSELNLRLSYGVVGNQDGINNYPYQAVYGVSDNSSQAYFGNSYYNMATPSAYDDHIKWEQTATYNAGIDFGFIHNRINGSIDFYYKKTSNLLNTIPIPSGSNFSSQLLTNVGNMDNKGVEFTINAIPVRNKHFEWNISFNAAYNQNKVTNLTATKDSSYPGNLIGTVQINSVGYPYGSFYVYHQEYNAQGKPIEGVYADLNSDGIINQNDLYHYQSWLPKWVYGFSTSFRWNRWTLSTVLRANVGNYVYNGVATGAVQSNVLNPLGYLANVFTDILHAGFINSNSYSDYYVQNASFLKMDNIGLSYNAGAIFHKAATLTINAHCQNVFIVTKYTGIDPEVNGGIDNTVYPVPRIYTLGLSLGF
ncbi:MAG: TonB-dependent receptor, partial [Chitinophagaceae bacterium]|nr:TonB-dependent receptor [Chitinophagaceae bacterium]